MNKLLIISVFAVLISSIKPSISFASTIYSNNFTSSITGYQEFFGHCSTSIDGLICSAGAGELYQENINNIACVSADFTNPSSVYDQLFLTNDNNSWINNSVNLQMNNGGKIALGSTSTTPIISSVDTPTGKHNYMLCHNGNTFNSYLDGALSQSLKDSSVTGVDFAFQNGGNSIITNLVVTDSLPTPSPTPTQTPSPTPTPIQLPVTPLKQTGPSAPWQNLTYDLATIWSPTNYTIGTWGCALTSAAMVLNYYNIHTLPNSKLALNPGTLDAWLGTQPDGYVPNGNVNWLAISRLTKQAKANNPSFPFDALEYSRSNFADKSTLHSDLVSGYPDILEVPGHFIVATGQDSNTFRINDPYYNRTLLSDYGDTFNSLGRYIPSFTDLSYILLTSDPSLTITLHNNGNSVGQSYTQQPLQGAGTNLIAGNPINILSFQQPPNGNYTLTVSSNTNQTYSIKGYLYDTSGNVKPFTQSGVVDSNNQNSLAIHFDNQNIGNITTQKVITPDSFLNDLNGLFNLKMVKKGAYEPLKNLGAQVKTSSQRHNILRTKIKLKIILTLLTVDKRIGLISDNAYQILSSDILYLQSLK